MGPVVLWSILHKMHPLNFCFLKLTNACHNRNKRNGVLWDSIINSIEKYRIKYFGSKGNDDPFFSEVVAYNNDEMLLIGEMLGKFRKRITTDFACQHLKFFGSSKNRRISFMTSTTVLISAFLWNSKINGEPMHKRFT